MSIIRKNLITNDWVIFATNREKKPRELKKDEKDNIAVLGERPEHKADCPFCPGNEKPDDELVFTIGDAAQWKVRVIANKFSSLDRNIIPQKRFTPLKKEFDGFGIHDVIIDSSRHNTTIALMQREEVTDLVTAYHRRYNEIKQNELVKHIVVFKNQGIRAGGSLEHPHSQIYGLPVIPFETSVRVHEMERYFEINDNCLLCDITHSEQTDKERVIYENERFISYMCYADLSPYHFWIVPKKHSYSFGLCDAEDLRDLADCMKVVLEKMYYLLKNPDYNFVIQSLNHADQDKDFFHWYVSVIPQIKTKGGWSYAGGLYVNTVMPEDAAQKMREAVPPG